MKNAKNAFIRGALEGAVRGGAYNIADVLDNKLSNAYRQRRPQNPRNSRARNPWNRNDPRPTRSRNPQLDCVRPKPFKGMQYPNRRSRGGNTSHRNDRFRLGSFVRDVVSGAVMGGLASVTFYGAGKAVDALKRNLNREKPIDRIVQSANKSSLYSIDYLAQGTHTFTRDEIPGLIEGKTRQATKIARAVRNNEIELNFMSDRWFEEHLGVENNVNGIIIKKICLRKNKSKI